MMRHWLAPPRRDDEYETFAARVLHYTLLLLLSVTLLFTLFVTSPAQLIFIPLIAGVFGGCYFLLHTGRLRLASLIFLSGFWMVITLAAFNINGIRNASLSSYAIIIIFSAVLFAHRAVVALTAVSILSVVILAVGETWGVLPFRTTPLFMADRFFQLLALYGTAGILLSASSRVIRSSFQRVRGHEQTLLERNRELELEVAERRRAEESLRVSEERYRLLFENTPILAGVYASDGQLVLLNHAAARTLGGTLESLQGRNIRDLVAAEDAERAIALQAQVMAEGKAMLDEGKVRFLSGHEMHYLRHIMPLPNPDGNDTSHVLVLTTDVTEKYVAEQRERELAQAQERNAFLTDFFSTLSHDLKTPLTTMNTSLYLLGRAATAQQREEKMARIGEQVALMDSYIQDMLAISRLEHLPSHNFQELDLNPLVAQVAELLRPRMETRQIIFQFIGQPDLPAVRGEQEQLHRLLTNLIENGVNYTPPGGQVNVKTYMSDGQVVLQVADSGIGIEPEALPHIFDRFFRTARARDFQSSGTGLGLAIVKKIVETHRATIEVQSQPGQGTTFWVQFPATPDC